jgi:hypothetical protein
MSLECPCTLSELAKCKYCTLLQGKETCDCNWQSLCAYDCFLWNDKSYPDYPLNTIISIIAYHSSFGFVVKPTKSSMQLPLGTIVDLKLEYPFSIVIRGVLLHSFVEQNLIYIWSQDVFPTDLLYQQKVELRVSGNAFWGHHFLNNAAQKYITIAAEDCLFEPAKELSAALTDNANIVNILANKKDIKTSISDNTEVVLLAGSENYIKHMIKSLPTSYHGKIVAWVPY